jgi:predicted GNAT superfamily acetyltransferase
MSSTTTETSNIVIREVDGSAEMHTVEELQKEVWGVPDLDVVPLSHLVAAKAAGGVLLGAFDRDQMVGFIYGFPSYEFGQLAHHSHMLAVKPAYRNFNLGYQLKLAQRRNVLKQNIRIMTWTFDPLQSLNAYFNFNKLGVVADRYFVDFYGDDAASFLHRNGTDRLWVKWLLDSDRVNKRLQGIGVHAQTDYNAPIVQIQPDETPLRIELTESLADEYAAIEIPGEITVLEQRSRAVALEWREATRWAFTEALNAGYFVADFHRIKRGEQFQGVYVLKRGKVGE